MPGIKVSLFWIGNIKAPASVFTHWTIVAVLPVTFSKIIDSSSKLIGCSSHWIFKIFKEKLQSSEADGSKTVLFSSEVWTYLGGVVCHGCGLNRIIFFSLLVPVTSPSARVNTLHVACGGENVPARLKCKTLPFLTSDLGSDSHSWILSNGAQGVSLSVLQSREGSVPWECVLDGSSSVTSSGVLPQQLIRVHEGSHSLSHLKSLIRMSLAWFLCKFAPSSSKVLSLVGIWRCQRVHLQMLVVWGIISVWNRRLDASVAWGQWVRRNGQTLQQDRNKNKNTWW